MPKPATAHTTDCLAAPTLAGSPLDVKNKNSAIMNIITATAAIIGQTKPNTAFKISQTVIPGTTFGSGIGLNAANAITGDVNSAVNTVEVNKLNFLFILIFYPVKYRKAVISK